MVSEDVYTFLSVCLLYSKNVYTFLSVCLLYSKNVYSFLSVCLLYSENVRHHFCAPNVYIFWCPLQILCTKCLHFLVYAIDFVYKMSALFVSTLFFVYKMSTLLMSTLFFCTNCPCFWCPLYFLCTKCLHFWCPLYICAPHYPRIANTSPLSILKEARQGERGHVVALQRVDLIS